MRLLADENFPLPSIRRLRAWGHDVMSIAEEDSGASDRGVLERAVRESRVILTFDRDYGTLIYHHKASVPVGVVYFRFDPLTPEEPAERFQTLTAVPDMMLEGRLTVVEREQVRQRPLPLG